VEGLTGGAVIMLVASPSPELLPVAGVGQSQLHRQQVPHLLTKPVLNEKSKLP
jgi:hypothetical protein